MPITTTFRTASGGNPYEHIITLKRGMVVTEGDCLYTAQRQRTRIVERTINGIDVEGRPFEPYSTNGPYYYTPGNAGGAGQSRTLKQKQAAVKYLLRRMGPVVETAWEYGGNEGLGGVPSKSGTSIRFNSYADFKASLGRAGVDLLGPRAPHMLQSIAVKINGTTYSLADISAALGGRHQEATEFVLGIYGEAAGRASGHNTGINPRWKRPHQRHFLGASPAEIDAMLADLLGRVMARLKQSAGPATP